MWNESEENSIIHKLHHSELKFMPCPIAVMNSTIKMQDIASLLKIHNCYDAVLYYYIQYRKDKVIDIN